MPMDLAEMTSLAPLEAASTASAAPMPLLAPVIHTTFPFNSPVIFMELYKVGIGALQVKCRLCNFLSFPLRSFSQKERERSASDLQMQTKQRTEKMKRRRKTTPKKSITKRKEGALLFHT